MDTPIKKTPVTPKAPRAPKAPKPVVVEGATRVVAGPTLNKKDFIERCVEKSGMKKKDVKPAVEAALQVMADAILAKEELNLPPFGKIKINREKDVPKGKMFNVRIRVPTELGQNPGPAPLAETDEDS